METSANFLRIPPSGEAPLRLDIAVYRWTTASGPPAWGELSQDGAALLVRLCAEESPLLVKTFTDDGPVWEDSCLELFLRPDGDGRYLNFEVNPLGAMVVGFGEGRENRESLLRIKAEMELEICIRPGAELWSASWRLPFLLLESIYGAGMGPLYCCNLYKCGGVDNHYGMWRDTGTQTPDFHRPEAFGRLSL